ncbi:hypothetical protein BH11ARM2_BH11ARM2_36460 [soil metagenome]
MERTLRPTALAFLALVLAAATDALVRGAGWGINAGILAFAVAAPCLWIGRSSPLRLTKSGKWLGGFAILFAALFSLRDSDSLKVGNGFAIALCLGAMILPVTDQALRESNVYRLLVEPFLRLLRLPLQAGELAVESQKETQVSPTVHRRSRAVIRGLLLALPLILVFGGLFASADAVFRAKIADLFDVNLDGEALIAHVATLAVSLTLIAGLLHRLFLRKEPSVPPVIREAKPRGMGIIEIGIVLGSLNFLFGAFLAVQFRYLFVARDVVKATHGLSFAEYARGGFFELVCVAALALTVLLGADALLKRENARDQFNFQWLGRALVVMVFCVVGSALLRMKLYTDVFGLTELRVYSSVFMVWLSLAFAWLLATTLNGQSQRFVFGSFLAGLLVIFGTNLLNPDALMVRTNLAKPQADFSYLETLSDDAVLAIQDMKESVPPNHRAESERLIEKEKASLATGDWRELNLSRLSLLR